MDNPIKMPVKVEKFPWGAIINDSKGQLVCKVNFAEQVDYIAHCINQHKKLMDGLNTIKSLTLNTSQCINEPVKTADNFAKIWEIAEQLLSEEKNNG